MNKKENNGIIDIFAPGITLKEISVNLSDEKLKTMLSRAYETAQQDATKFKFHKIYGISLSICGTLALTILTSSFNPIGPVSSKMVSIIAILICIFTGIIGLIQLLYNVSHKTNNNIAERDEAIQKIFKDYCHNSDK